jgi:hypothetical protein
MDPGEGDVRGWRHLQGLAARQADEGETAHCVGGGAGQLIGAGSDLAEALRARASANEDPGAVARILERFNAPRRPPPTAAPVPLEQLIGPQARRWLKKATQRAKSDRPAALARLGDKSLLAFFMLMEEADDWGGEPCVSSSSAPGLRGVLPHLKRAGLLVTFTKQDLSERGTSVHARFTATAHAAIKQLVRRSPARRRPRLRLVS